MNRIGNITVAYNRQTRQWETRHGWQVQTFPAGQKGRYAALLAAVTQAFPHLAEASTRFLAKWPVAESRLWSAVQLLVDGHVCVPDRLAEAHGLATVHSQQSVKRYYLHAVGETITCNCPDYERGGVTIEAHRLCKHILAYRLGQYLKCPLSEKVGKRKVAVGRWRNGSVTRVTKRKTATVAINGGTHYANGASVKAEHKPAYKTFVKVLRTPPFNEEKLMSWYIGR